MFGSFLVYSKIRISYAVPLPLVSRSSQALYKGIHPQV